MTKQQGEDEEAWYLVGETCSGDGAVAVYFLKGAIEKSKEKKRRQVRETRNLQNPPTN